MKISLIKRLKRYRDMISIIDNCVFKYFIKIFLGKYHLHFWSIQFDFNQSRDVCRFFILFNAFPHFLCFLILSIYLRYRRYLWPS